MILSSYPSLDLHGEVADISKILVHDFITDNYKLRNKHVVIIHGIGKNIVKKAVYEELKINKYVKSYKQDNFNHGCTLVELCIK